MNSAGVRVENDFILHHVCYCLSESPGIGSRTSGKVESMGG